MRTKLFCLYHMHYYMSYFSTKKKNNILQKYTQNKHLFISKFYFFHLISTQFADFAFAKIQIQITFAVILCFKQHSLVSVVNKHFDFLIVLYIKHWLDKISPLLCWFSQRMGETDNFERDILGLFFLVNIFQANK